jgi:hypothetical protein
MRWDPTNAIQLFDALLAFFDGGRNWIRNELQRDGRRCLMGAINLCAQKPASIEVMHYLCCALGLEDLPDQYSTLTDFNDNARSYRCIEKLIQNARALACRQTRCIGLSGQRDRRKRKPRSSPAAGQC